MNNAVRFIDNGDGTVTDSLLQLMWSKEMPSIEMVDHDQATTICAEMTLASYSDWRLPTAEELFLLADRSKHDPAIDSDAFADTRNEWYWTSTITASNPSCAWFVLFSNGGAYESRRDFNYAFVRAVRSLPVYA